MYFSFYSMHWRFTCYFYSLFFSLSCCQERKKAQKTKRDMVYCVVKADMERVSLVKESKLSDKRHSLSPDTFPNSFGTNHVTCPHYFSLMICHTWQKCDTTYTHKRFVLRGWSAHSLGAQSDFLRGLHCSCAMGGEKNQVQRSCHLRKWNKSGEKLTKHPDLYVFLSPSLADETEPPCVLFCLPRKGKRWSNKTTSKK